MSDPTSPPQTQEFVQALSTNVNAPGAPPLPPKPKQKLPAGTKLSEDPRYPLAMVPVEEEKKNPVAKLWENTWFKVLVGVLIVLIAYVIYRFVLMPREGMIIIPQIHAGSRPRPVVFDAQLI